MKNIELKLDRKAVFNSKTILSVEGKRNTISLGKNSKLGSIGTPKVTFIGNGNRLIIQENCTIKRCHIRFVGNNQTIVIGSRTRINGIYMLCEEDCDISIGSDCLISNGVEFRTSDAHSVLDLETRKRVNLPADICIGDKVWIGKEVLVSKGAVISNDSVVGARSLVTNRFVDSNVVIAGVPAKIVKESIVWDPKKL